MFVWSRFSSLALVSIRQKVNTFDATEIGLMGRKEAKWTSWSKVVGNGNVKDSLETSFNILI